MGKNVVSVKKGVFIDGIEIKDLQEFSCTKPSQGESCIIEMRFIADMDPESEMPLFTGHGKKTSITLI